MTIKTFICNICSAEVTKPKSYAHNGGRACKTHPEAIAANATNQAQISSSLVAHKNKPRPWEKGYVQEPENNSHLFDGIRNPHTFCWHCEAKGVYSHIIAERTLVAMSRAELEGHKPNMFDPESYHYKLLRAEFGNAVALKQFSIEGLPEWKIKQLAVKMKEVAGFVGAVVLCHKCAKAYDFKWEPVLGFAEVIKDPNKMAILSMIGNDIGTAIASKEMANEVVQKAKG